MKNYVKIIIIKFLQSFLKIFYIFPLRQNYILFSSFEGREFCDNPKYLYLYISKKFGSKYKYIWVLNKVKKENPKCKTVRFLSLPYFYYLLTSKYIISNLGIEPFFPKRKSQIFINTWHGTGAYKKVEIKKTSKKSLVKYQTYVQYIRANNTDYYVSGCKKFSEVMAKSWGDNISKFLKYGLPRNDVLLSYTKDFKQNLLDKLSLSSENMYILYAPTFRGNSYRKQEKYNYSFDVQKVLYECEEKWNKKFVCLYRTHIGSKVIPEKMDNVIDVSDYPDMQELLMISDVLITDYSSCMWDFALLKRPAFLYTPDIEEYEKDRGFYTPITDWPFSVAKTDEMLINNIKSFSVKDNLNRIKKHFSILMSYENGMACEDVCSLLSL